MSFINILLFTSVFCLVYGRPETTQQDFITITDADFASSSETTGYDSTATTEPTTAADDSDYQTTTDFLTGTNDPSPYINDGKYKHQIDGLMKDMIKTMDKHLIPLMSDLDEDTQEQLLTMAFNGFNSYLNYVIMIMEEKETSKNTKNAEYPNDEYVDKDDITVQFDELLPEYNAGLITAAPYPDSSDQESEFVNAVEAQPDEVNDSPRDTNGNDDYVNLGDAPYSQSDY